MSSAPFFQMEIQVPEEARALVIGKGGQTIKGFQKSPGISCARLLPSGQFQIRGDSREAVQKIASSVRQLTSRAVRSKSTVPAFYCICFCKSIKNPLLAVDKISFEKFPATALHISEEDGQRLCFKSGEEEITHSAATSYSDDLAAAFSSKASLSNFFKLLPHWDFSGYKTELLSCIKFLRSEESDAMRTVKMIVRFGKEVFRSPSCGELQDGGFVSLSYLQKLFKERQLTHSFSTACSDNAVRDLRLYLANQGYVKVSIQKKISIHVSDRQEKPSPDFNISVRCIGNESSLPNREVRRILSAKDYFQVLGVGLEASLDEIRKAFRQCLLKIEFQTGDLAAAEAARKKATEASDCLLDSQQRARYLKYFYPASKISSDSSVAPLPAVAAVLDEKAQITRVRREPQRHGIVSFCREGQDTTDFRLGVHSYGKEMEIQRDMVEWVERAWGSRTPDQLFVFDPKSRYEVMHIRYKEAETFVTEDFKFRIARVVEGKEGGERQSKRWECALSSRWAKWNDGIVNDRNVDSIAGSDVINLIDEAVKFSELMTAT